MRRQRRGLTVCTVFRYSITIIITCNNIVLLSFSSSAAAASCFTTLLLSRTNTLVLWCACTTRVSANRRTDIRRAAAQQVSANTITTGKRTDFSFKNTRSYAVRKVRCRRRVCFVKRIDINYILNRLILINILAIKSDDKSLHINILFCVFIFSILKNEWIIPITAQISYLPVYVYRNKIIA